MRTWILAPLCLFGMVLSATADARLPVMSPTHPATAAVTDFEAEWLLVELYIYTNAVTVDPAAVELMKYEAANRDRSWVRTGGRVGWPKQQGGSGGTVDFDLSIQAINLEAMIQELVDRP